MGWLRSLTAVVLGLLVLDVLGVLGTLATNGVLAQRPSMIVLALVVASVVVVSAIGARSRGWLANPYW